MIRFIILVFLGISAIAEGQTLSIKGTLQDKTEKNSVAGATVTLRIQDDSTSRMNVVSGRRGAFEFLDLSPRNYIVYITSVTHEPDSQVVTLTDSSKTWVSFTSPGVQSC